MEETIAVLSDAETLQRLAQSDAELARGEGESEGAARRGHAPPAGLGVTEQDRSRLVITPTARRQLAETLPEAVAFAAHEFIVGPLLDNPQRVGKRLDPPLADRHSAWRGTYRVLYRIDEPNHTVTVVAIAPRAHAYRRG